MILSTIRRQLARNPSRSLGCTVTRNSGASVSSVVKAQIVIEAVPSKFVALHDDGRARLARRVFAARDRPDLPSLHSSPPSSSPMADTASMKA